LIWPPFGETIPTSAAAPRLSKSRPKESKVELRQLRYFAAAVDHRSISKAAKAVHATQSTLSHQILRLEQELGLQLLDRSAAGVELTAAGKVLKDAADVILNELNRVRLNLRDMRTIEGSLEVVAGVHSFAREVLPGCVARFLKRHPQVELSTEQVMDVQLADRLRERDFGMAIGDDLRRPEEFDFEPLYQEEFVLLVPKDHPLAARSRVRLMDIHRVQVASGGANVPFMSELNDQLSAVGVHPEFVMAMARPADLVDVLERCGISVIITSNVPPPDNAVTVRLEDPIPLRTVGVIRPAGRPASALEDAFVQIVIDELRTSKSFDCTLVPPRRAASARARAEAALQ
jgi:LysR family cyn operon transcriptional activator